MRTQANIINCLLMGVGGEKKGMREIPETKAAARDEAFEKIIERVTEAGGEIIEDEIHPLYTDIGVQELETGTQRIVEFNLKGMDIQLTRNVETHLLSGSGHQKHAEKLETPRVKITMKRKSELSNDWQVVDFDEMF